MKLHIDDTITISQIQKEFNSVFPYLKIEFFKKSHQTGELSAFADMISSTETLGKWRTVHNEDDFTITADYTVEKVESEFQERFGISAQVFRKSGDVWLETSVTDKWTLNEQNKQGEALESEIGE